MSCQPSIPESVTILPGAHVVGKVMMGEECSVWYNAVIRAEQPVRIGKRTNIQDNVVIHVGDGFPVSIGAGVTIGHAAIVHGCTVGDNTLIGMGAIVLDGAQIGRDCIIGAGSVVTPGTVIPDGSVAFGSPARVRRAMTEDDIAHNRQNAEDYLRMAQEARA